LGYYTNGKESSKEVDSTRAASQDTKTVHNKSSNIYKTFMDTRTLIRCKKLNVTYVATENIGDGILLGSGLRHDEGHGTEAESNHRRNSKDLLCGIR
jgi:hypothetical protein